MTTCDENINTTNIKARDTPVKGKNNATKRTEDFQIIFFEGKRAETKPDDSSLKIKLPLRLKKRLKLVNDNLKVESKTNPIAILLKEVMSAKSRTALILERIQKCQSHNEKVFRRMRKKGKVERYDMEKYDYLPKRLKARAKSFRRTSNNIALLKVVHSVAIKRTERKTATLKNVHKKFSSKIIKKIKVEYEKNFVLLGDECEKVTIELPKNLQERYKEIRDKYYRQRNYQRVNNATFRRELLMQERLLKAHYHNKKSKLLSEIRRKSKTKEENAY